MDVGSREAELESGATGSEFLGTGDAGSSIAGRAKARVCILRDPHESPQKCSLIPLRGTPGLEFHTYDARRRLDASGRILLHPEGTDITAADRGSALLVVDSSWRRLPKLLACIDGIGERRRLPPLASAYPRKSKTFADPTQGLASVEALYAVLALLGEVHPELLAHYHWREEFLRLNPTLPRA
jgi:pre-rRNA-processing protein TSR3